MSDQVTVSAKALYAVLQALAGPEYHIRELQATRGLQALPGSEYENPIDTLIIEYNEAAHAQCSSKIDKDD